jgi:hypothetical protein
VKPEAKTAAVTAPQIGRETVHDVVESYLSGCRSREIKGSTLAKYKTLTKQLEAYCREKGYTYIDQLQVKDTAGKPHDYLAYRRSLRRWRVNSAMDGPVRTDHYGFAALDESPRFLVDIGQAAAQLCFEDGDSR